MSIDAVSSSEATETYDADAFEQEVAQWFASLQKTDAVACVHLYSKFTQFPFCFATEADTYMNNICWHVTGRGGLRNIARQVGLYEWKMRTSFLDTSHPLDRKLYYADDLRTQVQNASWFRLSFEAEALDRNYQVLSTKTWYFTQAKSSQ